MKKLFIMLGVVALVATMTTQVFAKEITIRGQLQRTVEPGGWVVTANTQKYLVLNAREFQGESWFRETQEVEATGETRSDVMTTFMEGTPFEVSSLRPVNQGTTTEVTASKFTRVLVTGDAIVQAQPDTAILTISVVTQARTALEAQQQNATKSDAVIKALRSAAGTGAEIKTSGYSLQPQRVYKENQPPSIVGFEARNSVTVTMSDLTKVGAVIDAASQAGANDVAGIAFTLRKDRPAKDQALSDATKEAISKAQVIASALNGRIVRIVQVQEEGFQPPRPLYQYETMAVARAGNVATPIEVGTLDISSRVQVIVEIDTGS